MSKIKSKSKPMREDFEERHIFEVEPEILIPYTTIRTNTDVYVGDKKWFNIGYRYSTAATRPIMERVMELVKVGKKRIPRKTS